MGMTIKDEETSRLAREVADLSGGTLTECITIALKEEIMYRHRLAHTDEIEKRMVELGRIGAALIGDRIPAVNHGDLLYDENGLPK